MYFELRRASTRCLSALCIFTSVAVLVATPAAAEASEQSFARRLGGGARDTATLPGGYRVESRCDRRGRLQSLSIASALGTAAVFVRSLRWEDSRLINAGGPERMVVSRRHLGRMSTWVAIDISSRVGVHATQFVALRGAGCTVTLLGSRISDPG